MLSSPYIIHVTTISVTVFKASSMILIRNDPIQYVRFCRQPATGNPKKLGYYRLTSTQKYRIMMKPTGLGYDFYRCTRHQVYTGTRIEKF